jgi:hypothetical protein
MGDSTKNNNDKLEIDDAALMMNMEKRTDATSVEIKEIKKYEEVKGGLSAGQVSTSALPLKQQSMAVIPVDTKKKTTRKVEKQKQPRPTAATDKQVKVKRNWFGRRINPPTSKVFLCHTLSLSLSRFLAHTACI